MAGNKKAFRRSPAYPSLSLPKAVDTAKDLYKRIHRNRVGYDDAIREMGFNPRGSAGMRALAALVHFGILDSEGMKEKRQLCLSNLGLDIILHPEGSIENTRALQMAAIKPETHEWAYKKWPHGLPESDSLVRGSLLRELDFNDKAVDLFIEELRETFKYAKIGGSDILTEVEAVKEDEIQDSKVELVEPLRIQAKTMVAPIAKSQTQDYTIPLMENELAILRMPLPLSKKNLEIISKYISLMSDTVGDVPVHVTQSPPNTVIVPKDETIS